MSCYGDFAEIVERDVVLKTRTSMRVGGVARIFVRPRTEAEAARILKRLASEDPGYRVLGGGSNLLVDDEPQNVPIVSCDRLTAVSFEGDHVRAGAGASLQDLVNNSVDRGLGGAEVLTGIPGTVGGAVAMNAGGRHGELADVFAWARIALDSGEIVRLDRGDVRFRYRRAELPRGVVLEAAFRLRPDDRLALKRRAGGILKAKAKSQPLKTRNAGCIFKNPDGDSAGRLIDACGLKGLRAGGAAVSDVHANFIVNDGTATFRDVEALIDRVVRAVKERAGVALEREIHVWRGDGTGAPAIATLSAEPQDVVP